MPKEQENLSAAKPKLNVLENGDTKAFHIEFNFYNGAGSLLEGITVIWKGTFTKVYPKVLAPTKVEMILDPVKSEK